MKQTATVRFYCRAAVIVCAALAAPAMASSIVPMTLETLADHAGQVIVGDVTAVRSYWAEQPRRIETEITLRRVEYLKGRLPDSDGTFRLVVPGGTVGQTSMRLAHAPTPNVGQRWILLLLPEYRTYPVVGLSQGAFRLVPDGDGVERVYSAEHHPVTGLTEDGFVQLSRTGGWDPTGQLRGAQGLRVKACPSPAATVTALSRDEFVRLLQPILDASRPHKLAGPAGKRVLLRPVAVPLVSATGREAAPTGKRLQEAGQSVRATVDGDCARRAAP